MHRRMLTYLGAGVAIGWAVSCAVRDDARLERVAEIEHIQWMEWSKNVAKEVSPERQERWARYWVPYSELPDDIKELDREWARKALRAADGP